MEKHFRASISYEIIKPSHLSNFGSVILYLSIVDSAKYVFIVVRSDVKQKIIFLNSRSNFKHVLCTVRFFYRRQYFFANLGNVASYPKFFLLNRIWNFENKTTNVDTNDSYLMESRPLTNYWKGKMINDWDLGQPYVCITLPFWPIST